MYYRIFLPIYRRVARKMCRDCRDFIKKKEKILDLGCGSGIIAEAFKEFFEAEVTGVDIKDQRIFNIPFEIIDGKNLAFPDKSFDTVLINYVLHHSDEPTALLREAGRVAKKIIIYEDLSENFLSRIYCKLHNLTFNIFFQKEKANSGFFKTSKEWENIFQEMGFTVIFKKTVNNFPVKKKLFVLGV